MKKLLIGLLTLGTLSAQASMLEINGPLDMKFAESEIAQDKTHFETLGDLFQKGTLPNLDKISNIAWAGRCFLAKKPNAPSNAGYIFRKKRVVDDGPLRETVRTYEAASYWSQDKAPNYYDALSMEQVLALPMPLFSGNPFSDAKIIANLVEIKSANLISQLKVSGQYLVEELLDNSVDIGPIDNKSVVGRCYYFIPDLNLE